MDTMPLKQGKTGHRKENINIWICLNKICFNFINHISIYVLDMQENSFKSWKEILKIYVKKYPALSESGNTGYFLTLLGQLNLAIRDLYFILKDKTALDVRIFPQLQIET